MAKRHLEIGKRIKELRETRGLTKAELARRSGGVSITAVWNWEENGIVPRPETFTLAAKALGVSESFLRTGTDNAVSATSRPGRSVALIIDEARNEIANVTGVPLANVRLNVEFVSH